MQVPDFARLQQLAKQLCRFWLDKQNRKAFDSVQEFDENEQLFVDYL